MMITPARTSAPEGKKLLNTLQDRFQSSSGGCREAVAAILAEVRSKGDAAVVEYTRKFDSPNFSARQLKVSEAEMEEAENRVDQPLLETLDLAIDRIRSFHEKETEQSWIRTDPCGIITGRLVNPVDTAGLYVPGGQGGQTPLVSSVLMNGIPAGIAGVRRRVMVTPPDAEGNVNPALLVAARKIGISEVYKAGSAWAIGALAYGTESIPAVDVIVGPGNQYVAEAKQQVSGRVRIDMVAGPSEVLIIADGNANPAYIAADMLAQAEHDPQALAILVALSQETAERTIAELESQLGKLSRSDIARKALADRGVVLVAESLAEAVEIANLVAIEHLELMVDHPFELLPQIRHAGAIFLGSHVPESAGDYIAGPNHVLPTMGTARFSSALGVETFVKKSSIISYTRDAFLKDSEHIQRLANLEGLTAHARSASVRSDGRN
ncbi:MAG: histidinol dehydrogenase [Proteobacteria bacterium]|nr:histidinol dehydrogenase [Pseudomonadota bacterium]MBU1737592.1 histidinol dehydrogenase [Pseudomonadota bacterium]